MVAGLVVAGVWFEYLALVRGIKFDHLLAAVSACAVVGLWRGVVWGRRLTSLVWVLCTFGWVLMPFVPGDEPPAALPFNVFVGATVPVWLQVVLIVVLAALALAPLVVLGWRRDAFRSAMW